MRKYERHPYPHFHPYPTNHHYPFQPFQLPYLLKTTLHNSLKTLHIPPKKIDK